MLRSQAVFRSTPFARAVPALVTALLWFAVAAGVAFWVLHFPREASGVLPAVSSDAPVQRVDTTALQRALGQTPSQPLAVAEWLGSAVVLLLPEPVAVRVTVLPSVAPPAPVTEPPPTGSMLAVTVMEAAARRE